MSGSIERRDAIRLREVEVLAEHSSCIKMKVAAKVYRSIDKSAVGEGYNGTVRGAVNCVEYWATRGIDRDHPDFRELHHEFARRNEVHAEMNALLQCRHVDSRDRCTMYCTHAPCGDCAKHIAAVGFVRRVVYRHVYKRDAKGVDYLVGHGISVLQLSD
jgi:dCMP deaminase